MEEITARYDVTFVVDRGADTRTQDEQTAQCLLTAGYTTFDHIRTMIGKQHGVSADAVDVLSAVKVRDTPAVNGPAAVSILGDGVQIGYTTDRSDLVVIDVDGRMVVGLSLNTGAVGVWPGSTDEPWTEVYVDRALAENADSIGPDHPIGWGQPDGMLAGTAPAEPPAAPAATGPQYGIVDWRSYADPTLIVGDTIEQVRRDALRLIRTRWSDDGYFAEGGEGYPAPDVDTASDEEIRECLQRLYDSEVAGLPLFTRAFPNDINCDAGRV